MKMRRIKIYLYGKMVGEILGDTYTSHRDSEKHFYIKGSGYPISNSILKVLKEKGVRDIKIVEHGKRATTVYMAGLEDYQRAVLIQEGDFDQQRVIPLHLMKKVREYPLR